MFDGTYIGQLRGTDFHRFRRSVYVAINLTIKMRVKMVLGVTLADRAPVFRAKRSIGTRQERSRRRSGARRFSEISRPQINLHPCI